MKNNGYIYFFRPDKPFAYVSKIFDRIFEENGELRVENENIRILFRGLTEADFEKAYNDYNKRLNLNFEPLKLENKHYCLNEKGKF
ncbi:MAG: hypothetical protein LBR98_06895 [Syntrophomonadaceae bacterium]|nr:hypothetical protein [Syntrophomonadaceae bacterium]